MWVVLAWIVGGLGIHSLILVHMLRYMLPLLPALALLTAVGLMSLRHPLLRRVAMAAALLGAGGGWLLDTVDLAGFPLPGVRPMTIQKIDKAEPYVPAGIPLINPYMVNLDRVAQTLRARHGTGKGVLVRLVLDHRDVDELVLRWATAPILMVQLPDLRITERRFPEYILDRRREELINFTSIHYPGRPAPIRHCYSLRLFTSKSPAPAGDPAACRRVLDLPDALSPLEDPRPLRLSLYHYPRCPLELCTFEKSTPRTPGM